MLIRIFRSGDSLDIRTPKELAFACEAQDAVVERMGNTLKFGIAAGSAKKPGPKDANRRKNANAAGVASADNAAKTQG